MLTLLRHKWPPETIFDVRLHIPMRRASENRAQIGRASIKSKGRAASDRENRKKIAPITGKYVGESSE
jgi:hypothetical protein